MMTPEQIAINVTTAAINTEHNNIAMAQMNKQYYQDKIDQGTVITDHESQDIQFWSDTLSNSQGRLEWLQNRLATLNAEALSE